LKILIIQTAFLGDAVLSTSLAESLHYHFPHSQIDLLVRKGNESIFDQHPFLHKIFVWDKKQNKILNLFRLISQIRRERYDEVINIQRFFSSGLLTVFSGAKTTSGFVKNPLSFFFSHRYPHLIGNGVHETKRNLTLITHLVKAEGVKPRLYPSQKDFDTVQRLVNSPYVCMAPASVWFTKQLPVPKWVELIGQVKEKYRVLLIGGKEDVSTGEQIIQHTGGERVINLAGKLSLLQTAALMKNAVMNYVNDSAPLHIASAMNAPVTAFFLSTVSEFGFGPLSENSKIIHADPVPPCRPCGLHGKKSCPEKHFNCAMHIRINQSLLP
jgi:heptosyltransferase-2